MEGENGSERENKCKLTPRYEKTPGSRVPREEKPVHLIELEIKHRFKRNTEINQINFEKYLK